MLVLVLVFADLQAAFNINAILCAAKIYAQLSPLRASSSRSLKELRDCCPNLVGAVLLQ